MRKRPAQLVQPLNAHTLQTLRSLGVPSGKERTLADDRARRIDPSADKPKAVTGNVNDGTALESLITTLVRQGRALDQTERGGRYGDVLYHTTLVAPVTPIFQQLPQVSSDTASTTNTVSTVVACTMDIVLPDGVAWSLLASGSVELMRGTAGSSRMSIEFDATESLSGAFTVSTTSWDRKAYGFLHQNVLGGQTVAARVRYRCESSGTTNAQNPHLIVYAWRVE